MVRVIVSAGVALGQKLGKEGFRLFLGGFRVGPDANRGVS
jgi:hypothetical protein